MSKSVTDPSILVTDRSVQHESERLWSAAQPPLRRLAAVTRQPQPQRPATLILGAYTTPREAYGKLIPIFQQQWKEKTGQDIAFEESYLGSGAQSRAIVEGFEADVAALSLEADINRIEKAGLITHDWKDNPTKGMVSDSIVVFAVRQGNPKGIKDWADLAKPGVQILTPNPKTSGGAMWNILALYGAAMRGFVEGVPANDDAAATEFLTAVFNNVTVMDKGARESITNFEKGVGDVAITYENEVLVAQRGRGLRDGHPPLDDPDREPACSGRWLCRKTWHSRGSRGLRGFPADQGSAGDIRPVMGCDRSILKWPRLRRTNILPSQICSLSRSSAVGRSHA